MSSTNEGDSGAVYSRLRSLEHEQHDDDEHEHEELGVVAAHEQACDEDDSEDEMSGTLRSPPSECAECTGLACVALSLSCVDVGTPERLMGAA